MKNKIEIILYSSILILLATSCNITKRVAKDDLVYMGTEITIKDKDMIVGSDDIETNINTIPQPGTRTGIGNIYTGIYNIYESTADAGFKHWVKYRLGEEPKIYEANQVNTTEATISYYLNGKGYFSHKVNCDTTVADRKVNMNCIVKLGNRYQIDSVVFPIDSTYSALKLDEKLKRAIIKEGIYYDRDRLDYERSRLAKLAGDMGFADFGAENVFYYVDTTAGDHKIDLYTNIITPTDSTFHTRYMLDSIYIYPNYTINQKNNSLNSVPVRDGIVIKEKDHYLDHRLLDRLILSKTGKYYNRTAERKSVNRLLDLGLFRFINIQNDVKNDNGKQGSIVQHIYITPEKMQSISGEVELNNRSGNFFGTGASTNYKHKNIFGHAESLTLGLSIQRRIQYYTLESAVAKFGYKWRENARKLHEFYPLNINQVSVRNKTSEFQDLLSDDPRLAAAFEDILIAGLQYYFTYSNQANSADRKYKYFRTELETSGNLFGLFANKGNDETSKILGLDFAQYAKLTFDYRRYFPVGNGDIATRIILGGGLAYGNSDELPYIKQYIIGGSNSLRGFRLRGLGPGASVTDTETLTPFAAQFVDQTGDIKLEFNVEYRFPVFDFVKGAAFVDAGNIWLLSSETKPEGNFELDNFYNQIGVSAGLGIRLDFSFFLIRMDLGIPLRSTTLANGFEWQLSEIELLDTEWRQNNLRYNIGIGYPF